MYVVHVFSSVPIEPNRTELLVRFGFGSSNLGSGSVRFNHVMLYFISKKSVTIAYVRKSFFAATNCNKIVFSSTEIVTKSLFFTLIPQDKVFNYINTSYQSYDVNTIKGLPRVTPSQSYDYYELIFLLIKNKYKTITKNECEKSLLKTNVKTIIKMNIRSLLK